MGVLATGSAQARPSAQNFSGAHVCKIAIKHLPQAQRTQMQSFRTVRQLLISFLNLKNSTQGRVSIFPFGASSNIS